MLAVLFNTVHKDTPVLRWWWQIKLWRAAVVKNSISFNSRDLERTSLSNWQGWFIIRAAYSIRVLAHVLSSYLHGSKLMIGQAPSAVPRVRLHIQLSCSNSLLLQKKKKPTQKVTCDHSASGNKVLTCLELWNFPSHMVKWFDSLTRGKYIHILAGYFSVILESWIRQVQNWMIFRVCAKKQVRPYGKKQGRRKSRTFPSQQHKCLNLYHIVRHQCSEVKKNHIYIMNILLSFSFSAAKTVQRRLKDLFNILFIVFNILFIVSSHI